MARCITGPLESRISQSIQKAVKEKIAGAVIRKRHVSMGVMGDPDLFGSLPGGLHFEIEVKRPGNSPTELQEKRLAEWAATGAITGVAHSVEEALEILFAGMFAAGLT
jgi:hypothetical protein